MKFEAGFKDWAECFAAMARLRDAYGNFEACGQGWGDLQVDGPRYRTIQHAGRRLDELGGYDGMRGAQRNFLPMTRGARWRRALT